MWYARDQKYDLRFALEAKPNEPRGDIYFPTTAAYLGFIPTLAHPEMVGVNPEVAHEHMAGLNFYHAVAQALEAGKLFHIDLNDQKPGRFDQDLRFGSESIKPLFFLVKLLEEQGYDGPRHFDAHAYRTEDEDGVWILPGRHADVPVRKKAKQFCETRNSAVSRRFGRPPSGGHEMCVQTARRDRLKTRCSTGLELASRRAYESDQRSRACSSGLEPAFALGLRQAGSMRRSTRANRA